MSASVIHRARQHLIAAGHHYAGAWRAYDDFRADRGRGLPEWPDYVYCPLAAAYAIVSGGGNNRVPLNLAGDVGRLGALAAWRVTQGIYRFDPALYEPLIDTPLNGDLPTELLRYLPEWCVYVETPGLQALGSTLHGAFAHIEWDPSDGREELRLLLDSDAELAPVPIHLTGHSLLDGISGALGEAQRQGLRAGVALQTAGLGDSIRDAITPVVNLLLYLCSANAEIGAGERRPERPRPTRTKRGWRLFPPNQPTQWPVGTRLGAALRAARQAGEGDRLESGRARARPHVRRAHWHTFLAGVSRSERRLKWLPPIPVNVETPDDLVSTVRPVK